MLEWIRITRYLYANEVHNIEMTSSCTFKEQSTLECTALFRRDGS